MILSIFPGIDLLGRAFEEVGFTIVRGPDMLWGGDIKKFHVPDGIYEGVIGGPPCQWASTALHWQGYDIKYSPKDLIPEYIRIVEEAKPAWSVMENVLPARKSEAIPEDWGYIKLRDWDCGGFTHRKRAFWIWPSTLILVPPRRPGKPEYSVLKNSGRSKLSIRQRREGIFRTHPQKLSLKKAAELQGWPEMAEVLKEMSAGYAVGLLGNGVPRSMGLFIARAIKRAFYTGNSSVLPENGGNQK